MSHHVCDLEYADKVAHNYEELVTEEELSLYSETMVEVSKQIILRLELQDPGSSVTRIKIAYLIESNTFDPWFIGTEYCYCATSRRKKLIRS